MKKTCKQCGEALTGTGAHNAVLCVGCWAGLLARIEAGERNLDLAREYGVSRITIAHKRMMYGGRTNE